MARTFGSQDRPWKWRAVESEENQKQVFSLFPPPLEIAKRRDFHIPTAATAILSFPTSNPKKRTRHTRTPLIASRFHPCRRLREPNALLAHARRYPHQTAKRPLYSLPAGNYLVPVSANSLSSGQIVTVPLCWGQATGTTPYKPHLLSGRPNR